MSTQAQAQLTADDVAKKIGLPPGTVGSWLARMNELQWPGEVAALGKDFVDAASSVSTVLEESKALPFVGPVFGVVSLVMSTAITFTENKEACVKLPEHARGLLLMPLAADANATEFERWAQDRLLEQLLNVVALLVKYSDKGALRKFFTARADAASFDSCHEGLDRCLLDSHMAQFVSVHARLDDIAQRLSALSAEVKAHSLERAWADGYAKLQSHSIEMSTAIVPVLDEYCPGWRDKPHNSYWSSAIHAGRCLLVLSRQRFPESADHRPPEVRERLNKVLDVVNGVRTLGRLMQNAMRKASSDELAAFLKDSRPNEVLNVLRVTWVLDAANYCQRYYADMGIKEDEFNVDNLGRILLVAFRSNDKPNIDIPPLLYKTYPDKVKGLVALIRKAVGELPAENRTSEIKDDGSRTDRTDMIVSWLAHVGETVDKASLPTA